MFHEASVVVLVIYLAYLVAFAVVGWVLINLDSILEKLP